VFLWICGRDAASEGLEGWSGVCSFDRGSPDIRWLTFLRNHREAIAAMDFFTMPTVPLENLEMSEQAELYFFADSIF
jgi:hypothetical protein